MMHSRAISGDLPGVGSTAPTAASHAHNTNVPTNTTAGHIGMYSGMLYMYMQSNFLLWCIGIKFCCDRFFPINGP